MSKMISIGTLAAFAIGLAASVVSADSGHGHGAHAGGSAESSSLPSAWSALGSTRDEIAGDVKRGALGEVHAKAERLAGLMDALLAQSQDLPASKLARVKGAAKQVERVALSLHKAADAGDAARTEKELSRLSGLLELIRVQYPAGALGAAGHDSGDHSSHSEGKPHTHTHMDPPQGMVDGPAQETVRVRAVDLMRFEPRRIEVRAGVPTRIELENLGGAEHSLAVKTADGEHDWVHLHAAPRATQAAIYRLDQPGVYPVLCTIPGHTEAGMTGELVALAASGAHPRP